MGFQKKLITGLQTKKIEEVHLFWLAPKKLACVLYLGMSQPVMGWNGKPIPMNHNYGEGSWRNDEKELIRCGLPTSSFIQKKYSVPFVHPFILNNFSGNTHQEKYLDVLNEELIGSFGFDLKSVTPQNLISKNTYLQNILQNKDLEFQVSLFTLESKGMWFYGPDGEYLKIR